MFTPSQSQIIFSDRELTYGFVSILRYHQHFTLVVFYLKTR